MPDNSSSSLPSSSPAVVVGLGKIGLPLAALYARSGRRVIGCDINSTVVETINAGLSHIQEEPGLAEAVAIASGRKLLSATLNTCEAVQCASVVVVIVPVTIDKRHEVDFKAIDAATGAIGAGLQPGTLVISESTLPVGTTARRFAQILEHTSHLKAGRDFFLAYSPERYHRGISSATCAFTLKWWAASMHGALPPLSHFMSRFSMLRSLRWPQPTRQSSSNLLKRPTAMSTLHWLMNMPAMPMLMASMSRRQSLPQIPALFSYSHTRSWRRRSLYPRLSLLSLSWYRR